ncbi:MAG: hypothetical protein HZB51_08700 [Chloroflexi bacterium]|nr:hypothetical protein [Chloroflexota bacterium]
MSEEFKERMEDPEAKLAAVFIDEYLRSRGQTLESICNLPKDQAKQLMIEASTFAATKLAEVENKARALQEIHGVASAGHSHTSQSD